MDKPASATTRIIGNTLRTCYLASLLFAIVLGLLYAGAVLFELWQNGFEESFEPVLESASPHFWLLAPYAIGATLLWSVIALLFSYDMLSAASGARTTELAAHPRIAAMFEHLCQRAGMDVPRLAIIDSPALNAYASGLTKDDYTVGLTTGLINALNDAELENVIAHELAHIKHRDVRLMVLASAVVGGIALICELIQLAIWFGVRLGLGSVLGGEAEVEGDDEGSGGGLSGLTALVLALPLVVLAWFIAQLVNLGISRAREYMADAAAAEMTGNPQAMMSALRKVCENSDMGASASVMRMAFDNPQGWLDLFRTHPPTSKRIDALRGLRVAPVARPVSRGAAPRSAAGAPLRPGAPRASFGQRSR